MYNNPFLIITQRVYYACPYTGGLMKALILAALLVPGVSFASNVTCDVNSQSVVLEDITKPELDLAAYRFNGEVNGIKLSILLVDGAYDVYAKSGRSTVSQNRLETVNLSATLNGNALTVVCPGSN